MKKLMIALFGAALCISALAFAQSGDFTDPGTPGGPPTGSPVPGTGGAGTTGSTGAAGTGDTTGGAGTGDSPTTGAAGSPGVPGTGGFPGT